MDWVFVCSRSSRTLVIMMVSSDALSAYMSRSRSCVFGSSLSPLLARIRFASNSWRACMDQLESTQKRLHRLEEMTNHKVENLNRKRKSSQLDVRTQERTMLACLFFLLACFYYF